MLFIDDLRAKQRLYSQYGHSCSLIRALLTDGSAANALYRLQHALVRCRLVPAALAVQWVNKVFHGCLIGTRASFGPGLVLIHPIGVVVNSSVRAGANVWIESGVVIGENRGRSPVIEDNVFIGSGAKVIGGVRIGHGAKIGANAVVLKDVPAGATAVGVAATLREQRADQELGDR